VVPAPSNTASLELALIENMAREDLNPIEEARACEALVDELGLTREQVARRVGRSRVALSNLLRLLDLPDEAIELLEQRRLSEGHGRALLLAEDHTARLRLARDAAEHGWSVRTTEAHAREANQKGQASKGRVDRSQRTLHADQEAAMGQISEALANALGAEVRVRVSGSGYRAELAFATPEEALALAERLGHAAR
jgi:ParB family transcriptional regulator, chromosome partitioning protein